MNEVLVDIRKLDLADRLGKDMISVEALLGELEDALNKIDEYKDRLEEVAEEPDEFDIWNDKKMMYEEV